MTENEVKVKTLEQFVSQYYKVKKNNKTIIVLEMALFRDIAERILELEKATK